MYFFFVAAIASLFVALFILFLSFTDFFHERDLVLAIFEFGESAKVVHWTKRHSITSRQLSYALKELYIIKHSSLFLSEASRQTRNLTKQDPCLFSKLGQRDVLGWTQWKGHFSASEEERRKKFKRDKQFDFSSKISTDKKCGKFSISPLSFSLFSSSLSLSFSLVSSSLALPFFFFSLSHSHTLSLFHSLTLSLLPLSSIQC